jgi:hypothetical protein
VKAAGRTLTVGELREALAGLDDNVPVTTSGRVPALEVETRSTEVEIGNQADAAAVLEVIEWVIGVADGEYSSATAAREAAAALLERTGIAPE